MAQDDSELVTDISIDDRAQFETGFQVENISIDVTKLHSCAEPAADACAFSGFPQTYLLHVSLAA